MEHVFVYMLETDRGSVYWIVEGSESEIEFAACETRPEAVAFCKEMVANGDASGFTVNE